MTPPFLTSPLLDHFRLAHGFFGRQGGVSQGLYSSLNTGFSSGDRPEAVQQNRELIRIALGAERLETPHLYHSATVAEIDAAAPGTRPKADGIVTRLPGVALGIFTADCTPVLFADSEAGIVGACHAGWRGALSGVAINTLAAMKAMGATRIAAAIGPAIRQSSYEVGAELRQGFVEQDAENQRFFVDQADGKFLFDLPGYLRTQLLAAGALVDDRGEDTYSQPDRYFSYRRMTHLNETDYGRQMSAILIR